MDHHFRIPIGDADARKLGKLKTLNRSIPLHKQEFRCRISLNLRHPERATTAEVAPARASSKFIYLARWSILMGLLRAILAIAVVFAHCGWNGGFVFTGGQAAVQCFYLISGFLISYVLLNNRHYKNVWRFYSNRALRIYPVSLVIAAISLIASIIGNPQFIQIYHRAPLSGITLLTFSNVFLFGQDWIMFFGLHSGALRFLWDPSRSDLPLYQGLLVPQAWTLGVELTFYLVAPFVVRNRRILVLAATGSFLVRVVLLVQGIGFRDPWTYRFFPSELGLFLIGALSQQLLTPLWTRLSDRTRFLPHFGTALLVVFSVTFFLIPFKYIYLLPLYLATTAVLLPLTFLFQNRMAIDRRIGDLSYPIYVGHYLVIHTSKTVFRNLQLDGTLLFAVINVLGAGLFALVLNRVIAKRFDGIRTKVRVEGDRATRKEGLIRVPVDGPSAGKPR
jgi:peptidoglycan/LPS O-acetylase OafA/YrhL